MPRIQILAAALLIFFPFSLAQAEQIENLTKSLQRSLVEKDISRYAEHFSLRLRKGEKSSIQERLDLYSLEMLSFSNKNIKMTGGNADIIVRAVFKNDFSVLFETWELQLSKKTGSWLISNKKISSDSSTMFNIKIPSERFERVKSVEIESVDIRLRFDDAILFFDNIPEIETALLIMGDGHVRFSPSHSREKHILQHLTKNTYLEDEIEYAFLRFSQDYFNRKIKIIRYVEEGPSVDITKEKSKAYSLFTKHYSRSFTVENSITGDVLSILPSGDQSVIEFKGKNIGIYSYIYLPRGEEKVNLYEWENDRIISLYTPQTKGGEMQMFFHIPNDYDIEHYQAEVDFNPDTSYLAAKAKIRLFSQFQNLRFTRFRFNPDLSILRIIDGKKRELFFTQDKLRNSLYVYFIDPLKQNETEELEIYYRGKILPADHIGEIFYSRKYGDDYVSTPFSQDTYFFGKSSYWYPESPFDDYFTSEIKIIVPPEYRAVSNGKPMGRVTMNGMEEVERIDDIGNYIYTFKSDKPLKSLSFIVGPLERIEEEKSPIPIQVFRAASVSSPREEIIPEMKVILGFFSNAFGDFPFEHLSVVQRLWTTKGGLSAASFLILQNIPRTYHRFNREMQVSNSTVDLSRWNGYFLAHEIAHQWWGHGVTWESYQDHWISEGLSQYAAILYLIEKFGDSAASDIKQKFSRQIQKFSKWGPITLGTRLSYYDYDAYQAIIYNKTALVFDMLKDLMGKELFFKGLKTFFSRFKYRTAKTIDFIHSMEETSGRELDSFFNGWFDNYDLPRVEVSHSIHEEKGSHILKLRVVQTEIIFVFPLLVEWREDGLLQQKKVVVDEKIEEFKFQLPVKPKKIRINSDNAVPGRFKHRVLFFEERSTQKHRMSFFNANNPS